MSGLSPWLVSPTVPTTADSPASVTTRTGSPATLVTPDSCPVPTFRVLYRDTQPRLLRYLHALTGDDDEDIASETWLHIACDLHTFHGDYDAFRGWATTIARHRALDHLRRHTRRPPAIPVPPKTWPAWPPTTTPPPPPSTHSHLLTMPRR